MISETLERIPCPLLFSITWWVSAAAKRVGTLKEEEADQSPSCYRGLFPPAGATQTAEIHNHLPALQTVWPSPRATTPPLFAHLRDLHRRQRISRGCVRPLNPLPTQPPTPNPSTLVRIRNFTQGQSAQQMNACRLNRLIRERIKYSYELISEVAIHFSWCIFNSSLLSHPALFMSPSQWSPAPTCVQVTKSPVARKQWLALPGVDNFWRQMPFCIHIK